MKAAPLTPDAPEPRSQGVLLRAASDLVSRLQGAAPGRIAVLREDEGPARTLLETRFPRASIERLDVARLDEPESAARLEPFDLIHSLGDLEWRPALRRQLPRLLARLRPGGLIALQFANDLYEPYRALARMIAVDGPWTATLLPIAKSRPFNPTMEGLYALMSPLCASVDLWETTYLNALGGIEAIVDFALDSSLAPFLARLDSPAHDLFLDRYRDELRLAYPSQPEGAVLMKLPRIFMLARR